MEQLENLYLTTLAAPYVAGSGAITVTSAGSYTQGTFSLTILDGSGNVILIFRVTSVAGPVFTGAAEGADANAPMGSTVVGSMLTVDSIAQLFLDHAPVDGYYIASAGNLFTGPTMLEATLPVGADFSWVNQGTASETAAGNALVLHAPASSTVAWRMRVQNIGADTQLIAAFVPDFLFQSSETNQAAIGFYESATGKLEVVTMIVSSAFSGIQVNRYASPTGGFAGNQFNTACVGLPNWIAMRLKISGGNLNFSYSISGNNFPVGYTEAENAFFSVAPDQWFYAADAEGPQQDVFSTLLSWAAS